MYCELTLKYPRKHPSIHLTFSSPSAEKLLADLKDSLFFKTFVFEAKLSIFQVKMISCVVLFWNNSVFRLTEFVNGTSGPFSLSISRQSISHQCKQSFSFQRFDFDQTYCLYFQHFWTGSTDNAVLFTFYTALYLHYDFRHLATDELDGIFARMQ